MELLSLDFVNSEFRDFRGRWSRDDLLSPEWLAQWLTRWKLRVVAPTDEAILAQLRALRALLTHVVETLTQQATIEAGDLAALNARLRQTSFTYQITPAGQEYHLDSVPIEHDWNWVQSEIITDFLTLLMDYEPQRLKICQNAYCRFIFYDETKSSTKRYCNIEKCANLVKLRRFRARQKEHAE